MKFVEMSRMLSPCTWMAWSRFPALTTPARRITSKLKVRTSCHFLICYSWTRRCFFFTLESSNMCLENEKVFSNRYCGGIFNALQGLTVNSMVCGKSSNWFLPLVYWWLAIDLSVFCSHSDCTPPFILDIFTDAGQSSVLNLRNRGMIVPTDSSKNSSLEGLRRRLAFKPYPRGWIVFSSIIVLLSLEKMVIAKLAESRRRCSFCT